MHHSNKKIYGYALFKQKDIWHMITVLTLMLTGNT